MSVPFIGEIRMASFGFAPRGWALCNGQLLPINQNQALFSLLGTVYGGDGRVTFQLPDLRSRMPMGFRQSQHPLGESAGESVHFLTPTELPMHSHTPTAVATAATTASPAGAVWADSGKAGFAAAPNTAMDPRAVKAAGGSQPHENTPPYLTISFMVALQGVFPSQN